ncbi:hypothetical protein SAMN06297387_13615 [Streptomyces zhaozhouensis]|uniref:Uncharacterized protein n=1 Tax=Streptomyces zhaozhouensis TaxID=1300267 RepID=A0A286EAD7_9ACTN|nr:hypothetical protein [Streptomyces zhaozhouensis]SOD67840.1 hypothetical protein SAMN06297387_13615 [Streptomyces zhaozhouensis]
MPQTVSDQVPALSPVLPGPAGPLGVRATSVATTRAHHMLMARDPHTEDGWRLPSCAVPPGDRPVRAGERAPVPINGDRPAWPEPDAVDQPA